MLSLKNNGQSTLKRKSQNPSWLRDELILALELYVSNRASPPGKGSQPVGNLSALLNRINAALGRAGEVDFRNSNGVYMKMMNFRRFDPKLTSAGRVGLTKGNKDEAAVWAEFADSPKRLEAVAAAIRAAVMHVDSAELAPIALGEVSEATEGRLLTVLHIRRERNRGLVQKRKEAALKVTGRLQCEACDFDFHERYGERGDGFIEVHHTQPLHTLAENSKTRLEDLALVCANCHRMIHRTRHWLSITELRSVLGSASSG